eukprot:c43121_g1_i1 orf=665-1144(-)
MAAMANRLVLPNSCTHQPSCGRRDGLVTWIPFAISGSRPPVRRIPPIRKLCVRVRAQGQGQQGPDAEESRAVLDAFFLGKAFAETVSEKIGTVVGEFLSDLGRLQAEQQRQLRDFQEEVQERAKLSRLKAARQALGSEEEREQIPPSDNASSAASRVKL